MPQSEIAYKTYFRRLRWQKFWFLKKSFSTDWPYLIAQNNLSVFFRNLFTLSIYEFKSSTTLTIPQTCFILQMVIYGGLQLSIFSPPYRVFARPSQRSIWSVTRIHFTSLQDVNVKSSSFKSESFPGLSAVINVTLNITPVRNPFKFVSKTDDKLYEILTSFWDKTLWLFLILPCPRSSLNILSIAIKRPPFPFWNTWWVKNFTTYFQSIDIALYTPQTYDLSVSGESCYTLPLDGRDTIYSTITSLSFWKGLSFHCLLSLEKRVLSEPRNKWIWVKRTT